MKGPISIRYGNSAAKEAKLNVKKKRKSFLRIALYFLVMRWRCPETFDYFHGVLQKIYTEFCNDEPMRSVNRSF